MGKIKFSDNSLVIANFREGMFYGLSRKWDPSGNLTFVGYYNKFKQGRTWKKIEDFLINVDESVVVADDYDPTAFSVPLNVSHDKGIMVGLYQHHMTTLDAAHEVNVDVSADSINDCVLQPKVTGLKNHEQFRLNLVTDQAHPYNVKAERNCAASHNKSLTTPEETFMAWEDQIMMAGDQFNFGYHVLLSIEPETDDVDPVIARDHPFISNMTLVDPGKLIFNMSLFGRKPQISYRVQNGSLDTKGLLHGMVQLLALEEQMPLMPEHPLLHWAPALLYGRFIHGVLQGFVIFATPMNGVIWAKFQDGVMHGPVYGYGVHQIYDIAERGFSMAGDTEESVPGIQFLGRFKNGKAVGTFWMGLKGGGYLHGELDDNSTVTGDNISFIYPDGETAFLGRFENKYMKKAYAVDVLEYGCDDYGLLKVTKYSPPTQDHAFFYEPPTNVSFGGGAPLGVVDPYELKTVKLAPSQIPNSGDGVIAIRDIPQYRFSCMYSMFLYGLPDQEELYKKSCGHNTSKSEEYRRHCCKYSLGLRSYHGHIDVPPELDVMPLPNLGPKVNHHFRYKTPKCMAINSSYNHVCA